MVEITSYEAATEWLEGKPLEWLPVLALRSALRVAPLAFERHCELNQALQLRLIVALSRVLLVAWGGSKIDPHACIKWIDAAYAAKRAVEEIADSDAVNATAHAALVAAFVPACAVTDSDVAYGNARVVSKTDSGDAIYVAIKGVAAITSYAARAASGTDIWQAVTIDAGRLEDRSDPEDLLSEPIWGEQPAWFIESWARAKDALLEIQPNETFAAWFERRI